MLATGITDFYDLTEAYELTSYLPLLQKLAKAQGRTITYQRFPITNVDVPDAATLEAVSAALNKTVTAGRKAVVHCWGGVGRTGTVLEYFLVRAEQLNGTAALNKIAKEWQGVAKRDRKPHSPETAAQCRLVETFA